MPTFQPFFPHQLQESIFRGEEGLGCAVFSSFSSHSSWRRMLLKLEALLCPLPQLLFSCSLLEQSLLLWKNDTRMCLKPLPTPVLPQLKEIVGVENMKILSQSTCSQVIQVFELIVPTSSFPFVSSGFVTRGRFASLREELNQLKNSG